MTLLHAERVQQLQRLCFKHVPKLMELALSTVRPLPPESPPRSPPTPSHPPARSRFEHAPKLTEHALSTRCPPE